MESNWRFNVWLYGLMPGPDLPAIGLAAPMHQGFPPGGILTNQPSTYPLVKVAHLPGTVLSDAYFFADQGTLAAHFPYGLPVDPDKDV